MSIKPTPELNLRMAWAVIIFGLDQHVVASLFGVNQGRVNEAVNAVRIAISDPCRFNAGRPPVEQSLLTFCSGAHTPGPWTAYDDSRQSVHRHQIVSMGKTIAHIYCTKGQEEEDAANASLIAAAPAMWEVLKLKNSKNF